MIVAVAPRAIVPDSVSVDPVRRAFVTLSRDDGAGPSGNSTGGFVSTTRRAEIVVGSSAMTAAFAGSALPRLVLQPHAHDVLARRNRQRSTLEMSRPATSSPATQLLAAESQTS